MPDRDNVIGVCIIVFCGIGILFTSYYAGKWIYNAFTAESPPQDEHPPDPNPAQPHEDRNEEENKNEDLDHLTADTQNVHTIYKKGNEEGAKDNENPQHSPTPTSEGKEKRVQDGGRRRDPKEDEVIDAILQRLLEKLERGEVTLRSCACGACDESQGRCGPEGGENTRVTYVTRLQYQCLLDDKARWGMMEDDLRKAVAEEMDLKLASMQAETRATAAVLNHTMNTRVLYLTENVTAELLETRVALRRQESRMAEMDQRVQEIDSRLALEPQIMEIRGFMKIDTFGPLLLAMGALQVLLLLCVCLLFLRPRHQHP